jgi:sortase A
VGRTSAMVRRVIRIVSTVLIIAGGLLLLDAGLTVIWQEPVSAIYGRINQGKLGGQLEKLEAAPLPPVEQRALKALPDPSRRLAFLARSLRRKAKDGAAVGRIRIPRIGASYVIVNGTNSGDLRKGPGIYEQTPFPGAGGTTGIAGHRTTYGAPFRHVDQLKNGNRIIVTMPYGQFTYTVERLQIVKPTALWVVNRVSYDRLVLSACHPLYSAAKRIIVFARLTDAQARGAARKG